MKENTLYSENNYPRIFKKTVKGYLDLVSKTEYTQDEINNLEFEPLEIKKFICPELINDALLGRKLNLVKYINKYDLDSKQATSLYFQYFIIKKLNLKGKAYSISDPTSKGFKKSEISKSLDLVYKKLKYNTQDLSLNIDYLIILKNIPKFDNFQSIDELNELFNLYSLGINFKTLKSFKNTDEIDKFIENYLIKKPYFKKEIIKYKLTYNLNEFKIEFRYKDENIKYFIQKLDLKPNVKLPSNLQKYTNSYILNFSKFKDFKVPRNIKELLKMFPKIQISEKNEFERLYINNLKKDEFYFRFLTNYIFNSLKDKDKQEYLKKLWCFAKKRNLREFCIDI